jgi:imidazolonepropionase-like amidohydrolase
MVSNDFLVTNVRVFDGNATMPNTHVAVTGGIIRAIGGDLAAWRSLPTIDGTDSTLVPGLIDAHVHVRQAAELQQALRFGVTTVLDMGTVGITPNEMFAIRAEANVATDRADIRSAGYPATAPGGHFTEYGVFMPVVSTVNGAKETVSMRREQGSDYLKIVLNGVRSPNPGVRNLDEPRVRALVEAAHEAGMLTVAHIESLDDVNIALETGVDGLAHVWRRGGPSPDVARRLVERKIFVVATLAVSEGFLLENRESLLADPRFQNVLTDPIKEHLRRSFRSDTPLPRSQRQTSFDAQVAAVQGLHEAGVRILTGSDSSVANPTSHGISLHRELELLTKAGMSPSEVLAAATANAADAYRLDDRGRILPGRRADMLLVRGDPTADVFALRDIVRIWKNGVEVDRTVAGR